MPGIKSLLLSCWVSNKLPKHYSLFLLLWVAPKRCKVNPYCWRWHTLHTKGSKTHKLKVTWVCSSLYQTEPRKLPPKEGSKQLSAQLWCRWLRWLLQQPAYYPQGAVAWWIDLGGSQQIFLIRPHLLRKKHVVYWKPSQLSRASNLMEERLELLPPWTSMIPNFIYIFGLCIGFS